MRVTGSVAALSIALVITACSKPDEPVTASAAAHASALAPAPQTYQRMRFVSPAEQTTRGAPASLTKSVTHVSHNVTAPSRSTDVAAAAPDPLAALASSTPVAAVTSSSGASQQEIVVALKTAPVESAPAPWVYEDVMEHRPGAVVIRGGNVQPEKCDPLSDMKARRAAASNERGSMRMPTQGASVFSGRGRN